MSERSKEERLDDEKRKERMNGSTYMVCLEV